MSDFFAIRKGEALYPDSVESSAVFARIPVGKLVHVEVKRPRNIGRHKLYWALCQRIASGVDATSENISDVLKIAAGHYTLVHTKTYGDIKLPKSIAFHKMDETDFQEFFERCVRTIYEEWGIAPATIADLLVPQEASALPR
jgi:hypothetical protein